MKSRIKRPTVHCNTSKTVHFLTDVNVPQKGVGKRGRPLTMTHSLFRSPFGNLFLGFEHFLLTFFSFSVAFCLPPFACPLCRHREDKYLNCHPSPNRQIDCLCNSVIRSRALEIGGSIFLLHLATSIDRWANTLKTLSSLITLTTHTPLIKVVEVHPLN